MAGGMPRAPRYPADLKRAVISHVQHNGYPATYAEWPNISPATIRSWGSRAGIATTCGNERTRAATQARKVAWEERRTQLVHRIGQVAEQALNVTEQALENGETRKASDASAVVARLVDKAQLLSGAATSRHEQITPEAAHAVIDEVAARRNAA